MSPNARDHRRQPAAGARALFTLLLPAVAAPALAQRLPDRVPLQPMEFSASQDDNLFSLSRSQEDIHQWEVALAELERGEHKQATERLHKLLTNETGGVVPVAPSRFVGLRLAVVQTLANLPPAAADAYEALVRREAGTMAERSLLEFDAEQLRMLAERFPAADMGRRARVRLGDLALEKGDGHVAAGHYLAALDAAPLGSDEERRLVERMTGAGVLADARAARRALNAELLPPAGRQVLEGLPVSGDPIGCPAIGGGGDGRAPMDLPAGQPRREVSEDIAAPGFDRRETGLFAMHAVGDLDGIYVNTGRELLAYDPLRRAIAWVSRSPLRDSDPDNWAAVRHYEDQINHDLVLAAACSDDVVVAALQVPENGNNVDFNGSFRILSKIPQRRLFAFSRSTGEELWSHFDEVEGQRTRRFRGHDSCAPPLIVGDTVYAPVFDRSGAIAFAIAAYDLRTGMPKWRRLVCSSQQDVNMFGNARAEFASSPLCLRDGVLYGTSNLGVAFAVEMATGRLRWITAYQVTQMPRTMLHGQRDRIVYFANNAPVHADRVLCTTPLDSQFAVGFDADTGRILWTLPAEAAVDGEEHHVRWLAGVFDDEFLLHGYGAVAVKARPAGALGARPAVRSLVSPAQLFERGNRLAPRGAVTADHLWIASQSGIRAFDRAGNVAPQSLAVDRYQPGNLLLVDGAIVSLRQRAFDVFFDAAALQQRVETRLAATPDEPAAILRAASLRAALLPSGATPAELAQVQALYQRGLDAASRRGYAANHPVRQALQRELFAQSRSRAEAAHAAGDRHALELLVAARAAAPDLRAWVRMQAMVIDSCAADEDRLRQELDLLGERAATETITAAGEVPLPVPAFLLWRRATLSSTPPATAVRHWQDLIELYGEFTLGEQRAAVRAQHAIAALVREHGEGLYAPIAARADEALAAAADADALRDVSARFPNSAAASRARSRLLDRSVRDGDLAMACDVLAQDLRSGQATPGMLRRVAVAARTRGNLGLAHTMLERLAPFVDMTSDWPEDAGATYGTVRSALLPELSRTAAAPRAALPEREVARIRPRTTRESLRLLPLVLAEQFERPADLPVYAIGGGELLAFDVASPDLSKPILFRVQVHFLEHAVVCGSALVVPDLERVFALHYRTGALLWELPNPSRRLYDSLGVQHGVLHLAGQATDRDGGAECYGIEPLTGAVLFVKPMPAETMRPVPKPVAGQLLAVSSDAGGALLVERVDPVTSAPVAKVRLPMEKLMERAEQRPDGLLTRLFPQLLQADGERIYVPIESSLSGDLPRVCAFDRTGDEVWTWRGSAGRTLEMMALRGDRVVIVEGGENAAGGVSVLAAATGEVLRRTELMLDVEVLNWTQKTWLHNPAPSAIAISDRESDRNNTRRFVHVGVDEGMPTFLVPLGNDDDRIERQPLFGDGFVTFGVRPARRGAFKLYSLTLADRSGALTQGRKSQHLQIGQTFGVSQHGAYTVISGADCLLVLGPPTDNR